MREPTESRILNDLSNIIFNVCEYHGVASRHYDNLVAEYHRNGEASAYEMLDNMVKAEQFINEQQYIGRN